MYKNNNVQSIKIDEIKTPNKTILDVVEINGDTKFLAFPKSNPNSFYKGLSVNQFLKCFIVDDELKTNGLDHVVFNILELESSTFNPDLKKIYNAKIINKHNDREYSFNEFKRELHKRNKFGNLSLKEVKGSHILEYVNNKSDIWKIDLLNIDDDFENDEQLIDDFENDNSTNEFESSKNTKNSKVVKFKKLTAKELKVLKDYKDEWSELSIKEKDSIKDHYGFNRYPSSNFGSNQTENAREFINDLVERGSIDDLLNNNSKTKTKTKTKTKNANDLSV